MIQERKTLKILYLITANTYGGAEHSVYKLAKNLDRSEFLPFVACLGNNALFINRLKSAGIRVYPLGMSSILDIRVFYKLYAILKDEQIDILHTQLFKSDIFGRISAKLAGTPIIISSIQNMESFRRFRILNYIDRLTSNWTYKLISVSNLVRDFTMAKTGLPRDRFTTIYNFVDLDDYDLAFPAQKSRLANRKVWGFSKDNIVIGTIGRLAPQKSQKDFLLAASQVVQHYPQARFVIAGEGPLKDDLVEITEKLSLTGYVIFTGFVENIKQVFSSLDIFVLSSLWEGLPLTICEAMAFTIPIVSTAVGGVPEIIENEVTGLLTAPGNHQQLAEKICSLISNQELSRRLTKAARKRVEETFSLKTILDQTEALYLQAAKSKLF